MAEDSDGVDEALEGTLRVALTASGRLAELAARNQEQAARAVQAENELQTQRLRARLEAERSAAWGQRASVRREGKDEAAGWMGTQVDSTSGPAPGADQVSSAVALEAAQSQATAAIHQAAPAFNAVLASQDGKHKQRQRTISMASASAVLRQA